MKNRFNRALSLILCLALCLSISAVAFAAEVGLSVSLDTTTAEAGSLPGTISMTIETDAALSIMSYSGEAYSSDARIKIVAIQDGDGELNSSVVTGRFAFLSMNEKSISSWATIVYEIPADLPAGTYTVGVQSISASRSDNSNPVSGIITRSATFTVTEPAGEPEKPVKVITEADISVGDAMYNGGKEVRPSVSVNGLDESDYVVTYSNNTESGTGTVTISPAPNGKYDFAPVSKNFEIKKAPLTITAKSYAVKVGGEAPDLTGAYTVSGLLGSDTLAVEPTVSYATTPDTSKVGTIEIVVSGAEAPNYEITYVSGYLTVAYNAPEFPTEIPGMTGGDAFSCNGGVDCPGHKFSDVDPNQWYHEGIDYVVKNGIMAGISDTLFGTHDTTTRGMIVTILYRLAGEPSVNGENPFTDVAAGKYYTKAVIWAYENKIVAGISADKFAPDTAITREQMATMLYNYAKYKGYDVSDDSADMESFVDYAKVSGYAAAALEWACSEELIAGVPVGAALKLDPQGNAERCQVASIIMRFCKNFVK